MRELPRETRQDSFKSHQDSIESRMFLVLPREARQGSLKSNQGTIQGVRNGEKVPFEVTTSSSIAREIAV